MPETEIRTVEALLEKIEAIEYRDGQKVIKLDHGIRRLASALNCSVEGQTTYKKTYIIMTLWFEYSGMRFEEKFFK